MKTSWGKVADWYNELLEGEPGTYQSEVVLPNITRLLDIKQGETVLDIACGQGYFTREFDKLGAKVQGVDIAPELIEIARKASPHITYYVSSATDLSMIKDATVDKATIVLALQNIEKYIDALKEAARVLKTGGQLFLVLNHPTFRIPKASDWGYDQEKGIQYRRIDSYLSESAVPIQMEPGKNPENQTVSFHRPLQSYFKAFQKHGLIVERLEEWTSHKKSETGTRKMAEDRARKEIPLFLTLQVAKK